MKAQPITIFTCLIFLLLSFSIWHLNTGAAYIATFTLTDNVSSQVIRFPDDSPIGIITSVIGALFFLALALRQVRRQS
ncbi:MAG: hypothetical protein HRU06_17770 [Oceanospirillaceae bacterium]|nr:hypothetical protein [Oceanospirillaceae bacterium]